MMPGIFQHGKMAGIGSIEPPSFEEEDSQDDLFGENRNKSKLKVKKKQSSIADMAEGMSSQLAGAKGSEEGSDEDIDLFAAPLNSEGFMA